ncbi:concanavalin A-like lectin/glucanase domain-containing protein [Stachybotrys elegans]|uniref:Concanavalin A-like lectin/glucanase domain-containing protein n=1 Tax=Stachybotrys elegans TaxID=80388 RepID=A0A8K0SU27_9HYPO|nr:concanavalin A-like lectin/glucanase domain-containing protein [Stachybotrys elegans]
MHYSTFLSALLPTAVLAWEAPQYGGFTRIFQDNFVGGGGTLPNGNNWNYVTGDLGVNAELQIYTSSTRNMQLSGGETLQLVPWRDGSALRGWTSGRVESKYVFTPGEGRLTRVEAVLRFGGSPTTNKRGIWPAWWMLGQAIRQGTPWPECGEIDILETVNGILTGHGTIHCDVYPGGACNEGNGIGSTIGIPDQGWHTWRVEIDRRPGNWADQSIAWFMDGREFHRVYGWRVNNPTVWWRLAQSPLFFILNVAVGGNWPGYPDGNTHDGYGSMMEVGYVAHYST